MSNKATFAAAAPPRFALWNLGFRPFYLLACVFAAASVPLWVAQYAGWTGAHAYLAGPAWHGHEMIFGYAEAVIAGFLFTAVRNWTGQPTPTGATLAAIAAVWLAARVAVLTPYGATAALLSSLFPVLVAIGIAVPLVRSANKRNYFFVALLVGLGLADLVFNLAAMDFLDVPGQAMLRVALDVILFVMAVMGGRVIPMFTNNGIPGAAATRKLLVERAALGSVLALLAADLLSAPAPIIAAIAFVAAAAHAGRLWLWQPWKTLHAPLVWILHASYAWIVVYLLLRGLSALSLVADPLSTHALTIGAIGGLTLGMMTRTARGHSGRPLAADSAEALMFALVQLAAVVRVVSPVVWPPVWRTSVVVAGTLWCAAFALYAIRYWPILSRPRIDGKPG